MQSPGGCLTCCETREPFSSWGIKAICPMILHLGMSDWTKKFVFFSPWKDTALPTCFFWWVKLCIPCLAFNNTWYRWQLMTLKTQLCYSNELFPWAWHRGPTNPPGLNTCGRNADLSKTPKYWTWHPAFKSCFILWVSNTADTFTKDCLHHLFFLLPCGQYNPLGPHDSGNRLQNGVC